MTDDTSRVSRETPDIPPNAAQQTVEQYVASRFGAIPLEARQAMGFSENPEMYMHTELMFRQCYWHERHAILERNAQSMIRHVIASRAAVFTLIKSANPGMAHQDVRDAATGHVEEEMAKLPEKFDRMPEL